MLFLRKQKPIIIPYDGSADEMVDKFWAKDSEIKKRMNDNINKINREAFTARALRYQDHLNAVLGVDKDGTNN